MNNTIQLELTVDEINMILRVLGKHPFDEVVGLMNKIKTQGDAAVAAKAAQLEVDQPAANG